MLGDCTGEKLTLEVALRYWSCKFVKISSFWSKVPSWWVLTETWQLTWTGALRAYSLFVVDWVCYRFLTARVMAFGAEYGLKFCCWRCSEFWQGKPINRWYLDVVVQHLHCINAWATNCTTSWNQKLWCDTPQTCSLMHSIKKACFLFWTNLHYLSQVGDSFPSSAPLGYAPGTAGEGGGFFFFIFLFFFTDI